MSNAFGCLDAAARARWAAPSLKANIMKIVGFVATVKRKSGGLGVGGGSALFGFQATVSAGCSESCRVGS